MPKLRTKQNMMKKVRKKAGYSNKSQKTQQNELGIKIAHKYHINLKDNSVHISRYSHIYSQIMWQSSLILFASFLRDFI